MYTQWRLLAVAVLLIVGGAGLADLTQTAGGVTVRDVRFKGAKGGTMSALLYVPPSATPGTPAPGILAVHGYTASRETQDAFAIEFARRGYVVLALDQPGHGYSDPPAFANGFGGPDGLAYLRSLDFVDTDNIGMEGHSMGGWAVLAAAYFAPKDYRSMVLVGSSTGKPYAAPGTSTWPRNVALVIAKYDEFSRLMWDVDRAQNVGRSPKLMTLFGASSPIEPGRVYGDIAAGTARVLYVPSVTHPGEHLSRDAVAHSIDWFATTLRGASRLPSSNQIWMRKEFGTLIAFVGFVALMLGVFQALIALPYFEPLRSRPDGNASADPRLRDWMMPMIGAIIAALLYYPVFAVAGRFVKASSYLPQGITNQLAIWILASAVWPLLWLLRPARAPRPHGVIARSIVIAVATVAVGYVAALLVDIVFNVDFRFWLLGLKLMSRKQAEMFLIYLPPFVAYFIISFRAIERNTRQQGQRASVTYAGWLLATVTGFVLLIAAQYGSLLVRGQQIDLPTVSPEFVPLYTIIAIQILPLLTVVGIVGAFTVRRAVSSLPGALLCALFVTWYIVAGQPTQGLF